jgi:hsp70-interacting protein
MSAEDRAFLEKVMKEGIINEGERMQEILKLVTETMETWKKEQWAEGEAVEETVGLLQEVRDIVEQIDYARAFAALKGLPFLLGCAQERERVPPQVRATCLGILSTMIQNNPPIQKEFLEIGAIRTLSEVYFQEEEEATTKDVDGKIRVRLIQALSASVRSHDLAEGVFCQTEQAVSLLASGLGVGRDDTTPLALRRRSLFLLRALVTSDSSDRARMHRFAGCLVFVFDTFLTANQDDQLREMTLSLLQQVLEQKKCVNMVLHRKNSLVSLGVERVAALRALTGENREYAAVELDHWETIMVLLARAVPDEAEEAAVDPVLPADASASEQTLSG